MEHGFTYRFFCCKVHDGIYGFAFLWLFLKEVVQFVKAENVEIVELDSGLDLLFGFGGWKDEFYSLVDIIETVRHVVDDDQVDWGFLEDLDDCVGTDKT
jgi:hypothetical protein